MLVGGGILGKGYRNWDMRQRRRALYWRWTRCWLNVADVTVHHVPDDLPATLEELRASGWKSRSIKQELRESVVAKLQAAETLFPGVQGYEETVLPQLEHALLAGHDIVLLGERGQAKTRIIRSITGLLDEWMPIIAGSEISDDPYNPASRYALDLVAEHGEATSIGWVHRSDRFGEKLATPDTSIADLIGEVDPIKVAEGRYLSDELTLHYGLVPRTNRGVFAINELPDLAERIQVGLLNVLEERDVQIRGYKVRLPIDVLLVATANPEDYTNRGRMITPLKDRFGAQIRTHYPLTVDAEMVIADQEAVIPGDVEIPDFMKEIISTITHAARGSSHVNQLSGVSVRLSVSNLETLAAAATRRYLVQDGYREGDGPIVPRVCDLDSLIASTAGKIEVDALEEGRDAEVIDHLMRSAVLTTFKSRIPIELIAAVVEAFEDEVVISTGHDVSTSAYAGVLASMPALQDAVAAVVGPDAGDGAKASAVEFVLEGLHLSKRLNKDAKGNRAAYRART